MALQMQSCSARVLLDPILAFAGLETYPEHLSLSILACNGAGWAEMITCNAKHATAPFANLRSGPSPSDGWVETLDIIQGHSGALDSAREGNSSTAESDVKFGRLFTRPLYG